MKIVQINSVCGSGSTGKICVAVSELLTEQGVENYILYAAGSTSYPLGIKYMSSVQIKLEVLKSRILGNYGFNSVLSTKRLINELDRISPDIVHLHNLHGHNVNLELLFSYLKKRNIKIFWTFHDCWAFTGYCPHYDMVGCNQWKNDGCMKCPQRKQYSWFFDRSRYLFNRKKELFSNLDLTIITPSQWLANQVKQSFLKDYAVKIINNGIDLNIFKPTESDFKKRYGLENKFVILGVAFGWGVRKGLDVFVELSKRLDDRFQIVLVGTDDKIDKCIPDNIISIHRTNNQTELAQIYTAADVLVNPTREEVLGLTNIESIACGTPVVSFDTGGCSEILDENCGVLVEKNDIDVLTERILAVFKNEIFSTSECVSHSKDFDQNLKFEEYIRLYE